MVAWLIALMASLQLLVVSMSGPVPAPAATAAPSARTSVTAAPVRSTQPPAPSPTAREIAVLSVTRDHGTIHAALTGDDFARAWRIEVGRAGDTSGRHIELSVETSDVAYLGGLTVAGGTGATVTYGLTQSFSYCDRDLGLCVASGGLHTPAADSRLGLTVTARDGGSFTVHAAVREVHEAAFNFGPWVEVTPRTV